MPRVLYLEPFHGGSHARFGETLVRELGAFDWLVHTLPARHWKWRMRGSAITFARELPAGPPADLLFASSYLPLAEFVGLRPEYGAVPRLLYFHENQLSFPVPPGKTQAARDYHFAFTQITSALAATHCLFNSAHNRDSFLRGVEILLARMPDQHPARWVPTIADKCMVLPVPLDFPALEPSLFESSAHPDGPLILWNHRWEHDKAPERFFNALGALAKRAKFRVAVCGKRFAQVPEAFETGRQALGARLVHWGGEDDRATYERWLGLADIAVSTARHEFFGISVLEAVHFGAHPLVPDALAYRETIPAEYRYALPELEDRLFALCSAYSEGERLRADRRSISEAFGLASVIPRYRELLRSLCS